MEDPADRDGWRYEVPDPRVERVQVGSLDEGPDYRIRRSGGTRDWLLIHTVVGAGRILADGSRPTLTGPEVAVLIPPGSVHDYRTAPGATCWRLLFAHFHPRPEWHPLLDWPAAGPGLRRIEVGERVAGLVEQALTAGARAMRSGIGRPSLFALNALETALLWYDTRNPARRLLDERISQVVDHVEEHLAQPLDLPRLAGVAHLSVSGLSHLFSTQVGVSPLRYLESQRMALAAQLLEFTNRSVSAIAHEVGYRDPLYFSSRFRRARGCSPTAYRERYRGAPSS